MQSEAIRASKARYDKENVKGLYIKLNKNTDADLIEHLAQVDNVNGYIKKLIRADIESR